MCGTPFKCPPAPYEASLLIDDFLRARGVREKTRLMIATPEPRPVPVLAPEIGNGILAQVTTRGIGFLYRGGRTGEEGQEGGRAENGGSVNQAFIASTLYPPKL